MKFYKEAILFLFTTNNFNEAFTIPKCDTVSKPPVNVKFNTGEFIKVKNNVESSGFMTNRHIFSSPHTSQIFPQLWQALIYNGRRTRKRLKRMYNLTNF